MGGDAREGVRDESSSLWDRQVPSAPQPAQKEARLETQILDDSGGQPFAWVVLKKGMGAEQQLSGKEQEPEVKAGQAGVRSSGGPGVYNHVSFNGAASLPLEPSSEPCPARRSDMGPCSDNMAAPQVGLQVVEGVLACWGACMLGLTHLSIHSALICDRSPGTRNAAC